MNETFMGNRTFCMFPAFHVAGLVWYLGNPAFNHTVAIWPLSGAPPSVPGLIEALKHADSECAFLPPAVVEDLSKDPAALDEVALLTKYLSFAGGDLPQSAGDIIARKVELMTILGASEMGAFPHLRPKGPYDPSIWKYFQFNHAVGIEFRQQSMDLYELVVVRDPKLEQYQPPFRLFPDIQEYNSHDLFSPHPSRPDLWLYRGRDDDVIVFLNGEKTNPISFEQNIIVHPEVRSAIVAGAQRFEASLLVELIDQKPLTPNEQAQAIERIWPLVQEANKECPAHARVSKSHILLTDPNKPLPRAGKGTVQRRAALDLYAENLDALYAQSDIESAEASTEDIENMDLDILTESIRGKVLALTGWQNVKDDVDFFTLGMDSLQAIQLSRNLKAALGLPQMAQSTIYTNASVTALTKAVKEQASHHQSGAIDTEKARLDALKQELQHFQEQIDKFAQENEHSNGFMSNGHHDNLHVAILTGSTGALGSYMLQDLMSDSRFAHIYCLNRNQDSKALQVARNQARGLPTDFPKDRVSFISADLAKPKLGVDETIYQQMRSSATLIIHNAWPVDFNQALQSFRPHIQGLVNLSTFAASAAHSPGLLFLSSVSAAMNHRSSPQIPETILSDLNDPLPMGYGESKYISERLVDYASRKLGIHGGVARVGQIAGPAHSPGGWNRWEWLPSLVTSSRYLGALPETLGEGGMSEVDWVPVDQLSSVLIELATTVYQDGKDSHRLNSVNGQTNGIKSHGAQVFHPHHPHPTTWKALLPTVTKTLQASLPKSSTKQIKNIPFTEWLELLRQSATTILANPDKKASSMEEAVKINPAIKLLGFYEGLAVKDSNAPKSWDIGRAIGASEALRDLETLKGEWMRTWTEGWIRESEGSTV